VAEVELNRAECEALRLEAQAELENSCGEFAFARQHGNAKYRREHERVLLACADLLGELAWTKLSWPTSEPTRMVEITPEVRAWISTQLAATHNHLSGVYSESFDYEYLAREYFLQRVLKRVADGVTHEAVAA
jgi:hypothetical protein